MEVEERTAHRAHATFPKSEHIVSRRLIEALFGGGNAAATAYPLRAVSLLVPRQATGVPVQVLISVPKKRLRHAVDRNRVKRQVREAYRHGKAPLVGAVPDDQCLLLGFVWLSADVAPTDKVFSRMAKLLHRVAASLHPTATPLSETDRGQTP